ncbi:NADH-quinone oxidoreductase subunit J [Pedobacter alpinus]|uniref:NADH-quinone oxidoreductase subunit J n=1 Tax=Pedobacter alpinus TaxID=1590643 RepID=A0ABW5TRQ6_9SPHI
MIEQIIFYILTFIAIGSAAYVVLSQQLVRSVFMFFVTLFAVAGLYVFALADFVALTQIVIYVGGVLVLLLFAFLLSSKDSLDAMAKIPSGLLSAHRLSGSLIVLLFFGILIYAFLQIDFENIAWIKEAQLQKTVKTVSDNGIRNIGVNLMSRYLLPLEMISILLMMALIGAAHIARKEPKTE